jgi:hypothetical protein
MKSKGVLAVNCVETLEGLSVGLLIVTEPLKHKLLEDLDNQQTVRVNLSNFPPNTYSSVGQHIILPWS